MAQLTEQHREVSRRQPMTAAHQLGMLRAAIHEYLNANAAYNSERQFREPSPALCARVKAAEIGLRAAMQERR